MIFQVWEWRDALYDSGLYFVSDDGNALQADVVGSTYYAISIERGCAIADAHFNG